MKNAIPRMFALLATLLVVSAAVSDGRDCSRRAEYYECIAYWCMAGFEITEDLIDECHARAVAEAAWCESGNVAVILDRAGCRLISELYTVAPGTLPAESPEACLPEFFSAQVRVIRIEAELDADLDLVAGIVNALRSIIIDHLTLNGGDPAAWIAYISQRNERGRDPAADSNFFNIQSSRNTLIYEVSPAIDRTTNCR